MDAMPESKDDEGVLERQFNKKFIFQSSQDVSLPGLDKWFVDDDDGRALDPRLRMLKDELNQVKSKLNTVDLSLWHKHTKSMNPAGLVLSHLRSLMRGKSQPELLTQAWCKFTECLQFGLIVNPERCRSVHLCEAPGAFVTALNHHLKSLSASNTLSWNATSLNPYYEGNSTNQMINDDRFISQTMSNWDFGVDGTGNILNLKNRQHYVKRFQGDLVDLITADGSVDCQENPAEQEKTVSALHLAEAAVALNILTKGSSLVIKMFTFFEASSACLLYLLVASFKRVLVFKPATSKEGNSEVYVICLGFTDALNQDQKHVLLNQCTSNKSLFRLEDIPHTFVGQVLECARFFQKIQCAVIERNLAFFSGTRECRRRESEFIREKVAKEYVRLYHVCKIESFCRLVPTGIAKDCLRHIDPIIETGSFDDRRLRQAVADPKWLRTRVAAMQVPWRHSITTVYEVVLRTWTVELTLRKGKAFGLVRSSRFCPSLAISVYNDVVAFTERNSASEYAVPGGQPKRTKVEPTTVESYLRHTLKDAYKPEETIFCSFHGMSATQILEQLLLHVSKLDRGDDLVLLHYSCLIRNVLLTDES